LSGLTDESDILRVAKESLHYEVRIAAASRLSDERMLADAAQSDLVGRIKTLAIEKMTDQGLLTDIARSTFTEEYAKHTGNLNKLNKNARANAAAIKMLSENAGKDCRSEADCLFLLKNLFTKSCLAAADKLADTAVKQQIYLDVICDMSYFDSETFEKAVTEILSQKSLYELCKSENTWVEQRESAVDALTDQSFIADIARNDSDIRVRLRAAEKLTDQSIAQEVFTDIATQIPRRFISVFYIRAIENLKNESVLASIVTNQEYSQLHPSEHLAVVEKLTDESLLTDIAGKEKYGWLSDTVSLAAANKLTNETSKAEIIASIELNRFVQRLLQLYEYAPQGLIADSPTAEPVKSVGRELGNKGGKELMLTAHAAFARQNPLMARNLEMVWDGICGWQG